MFTYQKSTILIFVAIFSLCSSLTTTQIDSFCHCDLTDSYCDMGCCCDTDCSSTISSTCFNRFSSIFCINSSYYYKIDSSLISATSESGCYYFNQTTSSQSQVSISTNQLNSIVNKNSQATVLSSSSDDMYIGYKIGNTMTIGSSTSFAFSDSTGACSTTGAITFQIKFRLNFDITCMGATTAHPFTNLAGKTVPQFMGVSSQTVTIPTLSSTSYSSVTLYFIVARYGSSKTKYIQTIKTAVSGSSTTSQTLKIRFVDPEADIQTEDSSPSFFPQIPYDIFYPLHQIAYKFQYFS